MVETSQKLKLADIQIETHKRSMTHAQLTEKEISQLPLEVNTYESLGRMFVLKESTETRKNLENKIKMCEEKIKTLEVSLPKQYYSNSSIWLIFHILLGKQNLFGKEFERKWK